MKYKEIIDRVKKELGSRGHDLDHIMRVYKLAIKIAVEEKKVNKDIDMEVVELAAILHDIGRAKEDHDKSGEIDHAIIGAEMAEEILEDLGYANDKIRAVKHCISTHRYRNNNKPESIEAKILFDADKLDSIGAIGIGRCFYVSSQFDQMMYNDMNFEEYKETNIIEGKKCKNQKLHSPNMEYEFKLKNIKARLFTHEGRLIAEERDEFMKMFFKRMSEEYRGIR